MQNIALKYFTCSSKRYLLQRNLISASAHRFIMSETEKKVGGEIKRWQWNMPLIFSLDLDCDHGSRSQWEIWSTGGLSQHCARLLIPSPLRNPPRFIKIVHKVCLCPLLKLLEQKSKRRWIINKAQWDGRSWERAETFFLQGQGFTCDPILKLIKETSWETNRAL